MKASVYIEPMDGRLCITLDVGRQSKIAEIDVPAPQSSDHLLPHQQAKRELFEIMRGSQFKDMVADGSIRMASGVTIADVVKEVKRALHDLEGLASGPRDTDVKA